MSVEKFDIGDVEFGPQLKTLISITATLKKYGLLILLTLFGSLIGFGIFSILRKKNAILGERMSYSYEYAVSSQFEQIFLVMIFLLVFVSILILFRFNTLRNKGMIIYEEITDEIDWSRKRKEFIHRPDIETRILIKEFLKSTDLPFTSGTNGQAFYVVLLFFVLISAIMIRVFV